MSFSVRGTASPRTNQRHIADNGPHIGARPSSARAQHRNPITGAEERVPSALARDHPRSGISSNANIHHHANVPQHEISKCHHVPSLNLAYLKETVQTSNVATQSYDIQLHSPDTPSSFRHGGGENVWGDPMHCAKNAKHADVPGLNLSAETSVEIQQTKITKNHVKQTETVWDPIRKKHTHPVPTQQAHLYHKTHAPVPAQQAHVYRHAHQHTDQYKQTLQDKSWHHQHNQSYGQTGQTHVSEIEVTQGRLDIERQSETIGPVPGHHHTDSESEEDEAARIQLSYLRLQPQYDPSKHVKKMDAEELEEEKRKQKVIETVMIDQLSRGVISDPAQSERPQSCDRIHSAGMSRGSIRTLHDTKVRTNGSVTEKLLSKCVRFGARIISSVGHDAMRDLTGFYFHIDQSLTIYEFRQFGKTGKALPFIVRGKYSHIRGRQSGQPYHITDIFPGLSLEFACSEQHSLPDTMRTRDVAIFRITDVDEDAKLKILLNGRTASDNREYMKTLHMPQDKDALEEKVLLLSIQRDVRQKLKKRGVKTIMGLSHYCRRLTETMDDFVPRYDLEKALLRYHIELPQGELDPLLMMLDHNNSGWIDYVEFLHAVLGEMNEYRKSYVRKAFRKIDSSRAGTVKFSDLCKFYNVRGHPRVRAGECKESDVLGLLLEPFSHCVNETVPYQIFEEYYEGMSLGIDDDQDFIAILRNAWHV